MSSPVRDRRLKTGILLSAHRLLLHRQALTLEAHDVSYCFIYGSCCEILQASEAVVLQLIVAGCDLGVYVYRVSLNILQNQLAELFSSAISQLDAALPHTGLPSCSDVELSLSDNKLLQYRIRRAVVGSDSAAHTCGKACWLLALSVEYTASMLILEKARPS